MLQGERAAYGKQVVAGLARALSVEFGRGWSAQHLRHCLRIAETFPDEENLSAVRRQLSWTHLKTLMYLEEPLKRDFYLELCRRERWSTRRLSERIKSMLYERTAISKEPDQTIREDLDKLRDEGNLSAALAFRDPYVLDFLELQNTYSERDLETAILTELQQTLVELGTDFAFVARQKRITIDKRDYYIDLLFFHRRLRALVAIKVGEFEAGYKGQMELYAIFTAS